MSNEAVVRQGGILPIGDVRTRRGKSKSLVKFSLEKSYQYKLAPAALWPAPITPTIAIHDVTHMVRRIARKYSTFLLL